jgi:hypothetical protein
LRPFLNHSLSGPGVVWAPCLGPAQPPKRSTTPVHRTEPPWRPPLTFNLLRFLGVLNLNRTPRLQICIASRCRSDWVGSNQLPLLPHVSAHLERDGACCDGCHGGFQPVVLICQVAPEHLLLAAPCMEIIGTPIAIGFILSALEPRSSYYQAPLTPRGIPSAKPQDRHSRR